jgi:hypothetical protein
LPQDARFIKEIQEYYDTQIEEMPTDLDDLWTDTCNFAKQIRDKIIE